MHQTCSACGIIGEHAAWRWHKSSWTWLMTTLPFITRTPGDSASLHSDFSQQSAHTNAAVLRMLGTQQPRSASQPVQWGYLYDAHVCARIYIYYSSVWRAQDGVSGRRDKELLYFKCSVNACRSAFFQSSFKRAVCEKAGVETEIQRKEVKGLQDRERHKRGNKKRNCLRRHRKTTKWQQRSVDRKWALQVARKIVYGCRVSICDQKIWVCSERWAEFTHRLLGGALISSCILTSNWV